MRRIGSAPVRIMVGGALVVIVALGVGRGPASGADAVRPTAHEADAMPVPAPLPSLPLPLPSLDGPLPSLHPPLPSIDLASPPPSPSLPLPSVPLPSLSPLPSVSLPLPSVPSPSVPAPTAEASGAAGSLDAVPSLRPSASQASATPASSATESPRGRDAGITNDRFQAPTGAGRIGPGTAAVAARPSWLVPSLAFGVPLLLVVAAVIAELLGGVAVLEAVRRMFTRVPVPMPRWMRGASDSEHA